MIFRAKVCEECKGKGHFLKDFMVRGDYGSVKKTFQITCEKCDGSGHFVEEK